MCRIKRMNVEEDRLSSLPDDIIHKILSFVSITDAVGTSVLSSRWRFIWTSMPYLNFSSEDFFTFPNFSKFVTHVLSSRNDLRDVYLVKLAFRGKVSQALVKRILNYAFSHNVQQLDVSCLLENDMAFPLSLFASQSLKHLSLRVTRQSIRSKNAYGYFITPTLTWELPALTTLDLQCVTLCDDQAGIFSKCSNLKNLTLKRFETKDPFGLSIFHPRLSNLTLENGCYGVKVVNVVAPQLENLTIRFCYGEHVISAPHLASLLYKGFGVLDLSTDGFHSLEKADICVLSTQDADDHQIVRLIQHLHSVKFLTLNLETVELLSSSMDLILPQSSPFLHLKSLKIYPAYPWMQRRKKVTMSTKLKSYLLDGSPGCSFTMVLREEVQALNTMAELLVLLKKEKDNQADRDHVERGKTPVESHKPKKPKNRGNMVQMKSSWENLDVQIEQRKEKACLIISKLQEIEELLTKLPAPNRAKIQQYFSSLCAEADTVISKITDSMKIQCDENQSRSSVCFHELATTLKPSS